MAEDLAIEGRYQVVFTGLVVRGTEPARVRKNLKQQFQLPDDKLDKLFSGQNIAIQKDINWHDAQRYRDLMKELGALCEILPLEEPGPNKTSVKSFPCPKCRNLLTGNICNSCGFDVGAYRKQMRAKGYIELSGTGYIRERREGERRVGDDRRDGVRFEDGRRVGKDRRKYETGWDDN